MNDLIREIEEDMARERMHALWRRYGKLMVTVVVLLVLGTAASSAWRTMQAKKHAEQGETFAAAAALEEKKEFAKAAEAFAKIAGTEKGYPALASLRAAANLAESGKKDEALGRYDAIASSAADTVWKDLAVMNASALRMDGGAPLAAEPLKALTAASAEGRPYRDSAVELLALHYLLAGDRAKAKELLTPLAARADLPEHLSIRVQTLLSAVEGNVSVPQPATPVAKP